MAWVMTDPGTTLNVPAGWSAVNSQSGAQLYYKSNCSGGETAPTFAVGSGTVLTVAAQLAEFNAVATSSALDQSAEVSGSTSPLSATNTSVDATSGSLLVSASCWDLSKAGTCTTATTYNNATTQNVGNNDATSVGLHCRFAYGITTGNASADSASETNNSMNLSTLFSSSLQIASFKAAGAAAAVPQRPTVIGQAVQRASLWCKGERIWTPNRRIFVPA